MDKTPKKWEKVRIFNTFKDANELRCAMLDNDDTKLLQVKIKRCGPGGTQFKVKKYFPGFIKDKANDNS